MLYLVPSSNWIATRWHLYDGSTRTKFDLTEEKIAQKKLSAVVLGRNLIIHDGRGWFSSEQSEIYENNISVGTLITTHSGKLTLRTKAAEYVITAKPASIWSFETEFCAIVTLLGVQMGEILRMYETIKDMDEIDYSKLAHPSDKELLIYAAYWFGCDFASQSSA
jgi:hypothetical protein